MARKPGCLCSSSLQSAGGPLPGGLPACCAGGNVSTEGQKSPWAGWAVLPLGGCALGARVWGSPARLGADQGRAPCSGRRGSCAAREELPGRKLSEAEPCHGGLAAQRKHRDCAVRRRSLSVQPPRCAAAVLAAIALRGLATRASPCSHRPALHRQARLELPETLRAPLAHPRGQGGAARPAGRCSFR